MRKSLSALLTVLALTTPALGQEDACGASGLQFLVGKESSALSAYEPGPKLRIIEFGTAVTMDYFADRLNIELGEDGRVTRVYCG